MRLDLARVRYRFRRAVLHSGRLAPVYASVRPGARPYLTQRDTDLLIEGYPRSANTFAVVAFEHANGTGLKIAHHLHTPVNLERAARFGVPAIALIRAPLPTLASHLVRSPWITPQDALTGYLTFYTRVHRLSARVLVADYEEVITDFGRVIVRANARFDSTFAPYIANSENDRVVLARIDELDAADNGGARNVLRACRPDSGKDASKADALNRLRAPELAGLVSEAQAIYQELTAAR